MSKSSKPQTAIKLPSFQTINDSLFSRSRNTKMFQFIKKLFKQRNADRGEFHKFSQLPQEIQNMIWAYALCVDAPRAYFVDVKDWFRQPWQVKAVHTLPTSLGDFPLPPASNPNSDYGLMRVCRASCEEVTRSWSLWQPRVPARIVLANSHDGGRRAKAFSSLYIDATSDLVLIDRWWQERRSVSSFHGVTEFMLPGNNRYQGLETIRTVAVPVDSNLERSYKPQYLIHLKALFPALRTLYLYLQPRLLVPADSRQQEMPINFLAPEYRKDQVPSARFRARGRIFYEICPVKMRSAGLLVPSFEDDVITIKFMTWQWIQ
ncbi:hypothetical protein FOXG_04994 [Fusarium oxysporum f. sp. lycopersici 4287]|uniref:2EXR domain-containing protein n=2 Tax=Fusarium oxysporum TaxID=5507 RepID=A0A0J9USE2_FUSO4|nr:hypothetical protein FOXG_04994 [Fusarium oxysporum f. sp. lycopersici 4287]EXK38805.1 hypothetical protein FOMG_06339 [Fusarium oxysporum f. sp. melonis 26406]KAJ9421611.1 hypothetical protein QL093DRAFT_2290374 [Fusarium oxysporum]KNB01873.1 hypothetical protein FOXG_04994 [Fusarium oxysporum f. sp. lycopersici 4287]